MLFSNLLLERVIYEARYEHGLLFWDNSGKTLAAFMTHYPRFELRNVKLSNAQSDWWDEGLSMNFDHQKLDATQDFPITLEVFKQVCAKLTEILIAHLDIKTFSRVGARYIFSFPTKTREEAKDFVANLPLVVVDPAKVRPFGNNVVDRELALRIEDENRGYTIRISHPNRALNINVPRPAKVSTDAFPQHSVLLDVDAYTKKLVDASGFVVPDFIRITHRNIEENLLAFMGL